MTSERLKVLINSSTPIGIIETVEEMRAVSMVRQACSELNLAVFEWTIADGLVRSGNRNPVSDPNPQVRAIPAHPTGAGSTPTPIYNTADPVQALANMEAMTVEGVKDFP